jgi:hypothetical protein
MCEMPERVSQDHKERGRHDEAILVHGEIVMNAMEQEVQRNAHTVVGQIAKAKSARDHQISEVIGTY